MKKIFSSLIILFLLVIAACGGPYTSTASYLFVVEKGYSEDYTESWIIAYDPNNTEKQENVKIVVEEPMVWNLIEVNKTYFTSYSKERDNSWILDQIEHFGDDDTLR